MSQEQAKALAARHYCPLCGRMDLISPHPKSNGELMPLDWAEVQSFIANAPMTDPTKASAALAFTAMLEERRLFLAAIERYARLHGGTLFVARNTDEVQP